MTMGRLKLAGDTNKSELLKLSQLEDMNLYGDIICVWHETPTFSEQDSLVGREFALNGKLQQVVTRPPDVLVILFVPSEPP